MILIMTKLPRKDHDADNKPTNYKEQARITNKQITTNKRQHQSDNNKQITTINHQQPQITGNYPQNNNK